MKFNVHIVLIIIGIEILNFVLCSEPHLSIVHIKQGNEPGGRWKTRTEWKAQWVKEWIPKKVYVATWKRVWTPVEVREWFPFPKPPPGWLPH